MYATAATGGLYISTDGGENWTVTGTDKLSRNNCASICIDHTNDQVLYLGSGDPNYYSTYNGIYKSTNGGATWTLSNSGIGNRMAVDILMSPSDRNVLIAATNDGIWKSTDAGATWTVRKSGGTFTQMIFKPGDANTVYAATHTQFFRSTDMGTTWTQITLSGSGYQNGGRIGVSKADPNIVYLTYVGDFNAGTSTPVLKSIDSGQSFSVVKTPGQPNLNGYNSNEGGQGNYNYAITVAPNNADIVYIVGHVVWKSTNGGTSWSKLTDWWAKVHTDMHEILISPYDNNKLYNVNDGGVWLSTDGGNNWTPKSNGLSCTEIYRSAQSPIRKDLIDIGTQDNGELHYINNTWYTNGGGDYGGHVAFDYQDAQNVYHLNDRSRKRLAGSGGAPAFNLPFTDSDNNGNNTEIEFHPSQTNTAFASYTDVYRTTNLASAPTWTKISSFSTQVKALVCSPANMNLLYAVTNNGRVYRSDNALAASPTFANLAAPAATNVRTSIAPINNNVNVVYISCGSKVYRSGDKGATWTDVSNGLPNVNINKIYHDKYSTDESVYVGMATGIYYKNNSMSSWINFSNGLPTIANINEIMLYNDGTANSEIRVSYYGRGVWGSSLFSNTNSFVAISSPTNGAIITPNSNLTISADVSVGTGKSITKVEFYHGASLLGTSTTSPYKFTWNSVPAGTYALTAKAYESSGAIVTSSVVNINVAPIGATFYEDCNYGGYAVSLVAGKYTASQLSSAGIKNNDISSLKVISGYQIILYNDDNFQGSSLTITSDNGCLVANGFNDLTSSIEVVQLNNSPSVAITAPANNASYTAPASISITASASDSDGSIAKVEFYNGSTLLSTSTSSPYTYNWTNVAVGNYTLTARAYDNGGATTTSAAIAVKVNAPNQMPTVSITAPANNAAFTAPASITITANAADSDGSISKVEFYNGSTLLSTSTSSPYTYSWTNVAAGNYSLTAKAYDNVQAVTTSSAISVKVNAPNQAPAVSITAPANNAGYTAPASVSITANASDSDGSISKVEFYNGSTLLSTSTSSPYAYSWTNVAPGSYSLKAIAYDNTGATTTSATVSITVNAANAIATVYEHCNYDGYAIGLGIGDYTLSQLIALGVKNNDLSSVKVQSGYQITLYADDNFQGTALVVTSDNSCVVANNFNDQTTSIKVSAVVSNNSPSVAITSPSNNTNYTAPASISIAATASDSDGSITKVELYNGSSLLVTLTSGPYNYNWTNVAAGNYSITAKAYDNQGATTTSSVVSVKVNAPNQAPSVAITAPANNSTYTAPASISVTATASDSDGSITKVELYNGSTLLATLTTSPYTYNWTNVAAGTYSLTAKAFDNAGAVATSSVITAKVNAPNQAPSVSITAPANNASYTAPASIAISANATDSDGSITKVEFYNGSSLLATKTGSPYTHTWTGVAAGTYSLTAKAYDNNGAITTSSIITVKVTSANACATIPTYVENGGYTAGSVVQNTGSQYKCKPWPYSGWCNGGAWAYAPGTGAYWTDAWELIGPCGTPSIPSMTETKKQSVLSSSPNPFDGQTTLKVEVEVAGNVTIDIYNAQGIKVSEIYSGYLNAGSHSFDISLSQKEGTYICKVQMPNKLETINLLKVSRPKAMK